jgi:hypothetical protein
MLAVAAAEGVAFITGAATVIAALLLGSLAAWTTDRRLTKQIGDSGRARRDDRDERGAVECAVAQISR